MGQWPMGAEEGADVAERWSTLDQIEAALARYEQRMPGWVRPTAYAVGVVTEDGTHFPTVNVGAHHLPAVVLAGVCGYGSGNWTYLLTAVELERAIGLLSPAEAWTGTDHPNLRAWREVLREVRSQPLEDRPIVAVFIGRLEQPPRDEHQLELLKRISGGQG